MSKPLCFFFWTATLSSLATLYCKCAAILSIHDDVCLSVEISDYIWKKYIYDFVKAPVTFAEICFFLSTQAVSLLLWAVKQKHMKTQSFCTAFPYYDYRIVWRGLNGNEHCHLLQVNGNRNSLMDVSRNIKHKYKRIKATLYLSSNKNKNFRAKTYFGMCCYWKTISFMVVIALPCWLLT